MKNFESVKQATLAHYDRMIAWAEKQDPNADAFRFAMHSAIGESWKGDDCPMCRASLGGFGTIGNCDICPISLTVKQGGCEGTPWFKMAYSSTWSEWLIAAKAEREFLANLKNKKAIK